jgi:hypothetical protein
LQFSIKEMMEEENIVSIVNQAKSELKLAMEC